ncbi:replication factor C subunit [Cavenderia fasciculata]|uniref:Replication factor C subunit n=1 Tax=Cavenderia fasciculata TaxID=261658 RepID=F4Q8U6_CACFS|nr:replication factor C subunit [Cavenderia fasciculata]EGG15115.1 replication factor C subunit [Cavenderia fasciculata]|eukprot:XP_004351835.1 replication factor C subunit [Cavenderia fasciculata]
MLWVDKYKPTSLDHMDYHPDLSLHLKNMIKSSDFPHLLVYGPSGAGKKTRIMAILKEVYGPNCLKLKIDHRTFKHPSTNKNLQVTTISSPYHIEINAGEAGSNDRLIVQSIIKEIAQSPPIDSSVFGAFKIVILNEVDKLSKDAQHALRRTMEKYAASCRLILCCDSTSRVIDPIRSRCLGIRVPAPSIADVQNVLNIVATKEKFELPKKISEEIAVKAKGNLRYALLMLEAKKAKQYPFVEGVPLLDWENYIQVIARDIIMEQTPAKLMAVRAKLYELIGHCIPPELIIKTLTLELLDSIDNSLKCETIHWAAFYEHRIQIGTKPIFHLEAFIAKFMSCYKKFNSEPFVAQ